MGIELAEYLLLDGHVFEDSLDHQIGLLQAFPFEAGLQACLIGRRGLGGELARRHALTVVIANVLPPAFERGLILLQQQYGQAGIERRDGNA
ncbi:hypothetical protein D3C72_1600150 [compost metagenome]